MTSRGVAAFAMVVLAAVGTTSSARAAPGEPAPVRADQLFREGQAMLARGDVPGACAKLADSYALDPALGTLLNLAYCHEKQGRLYTAWTEFVRGEIQAVRSEQQERASFAAEHRLAVAAKLPRARLVAPARVTALRIDGQRYDAVLDGSPVVVPPGTHELVIEMADGQKKSASATFPAEGGVTIDVRFGDDASRGSSPGAATGDAPKAGEEGGDGDTARTVGFVLGGVGIVALGIGTYFGIATFTKKGDASKGCSPAGCTPDGKRDGDSAHTNATLSTVFFVTGALATAAGVYLVITAPKSPARAAIVLGPGAAGVQGTF